MMKNLFTLFALVCCASLFGQSTFSIEPLNPTAVYDANADDPKAENIITNLTSGNNHISWERTIINITQDCDTYVCDPVYCYGPNAQAKTFTLSANDTGLVSVHLLLPDVMSATTVVRLKFFDTQNPADSIITVYTVSTEVTGTDEQAAAAAINLFPNPTVESFTLANADMISAIRIFSLDGRQVSRFEAEPSQVYSLAGYPAGAYIVVMENAKGQVVRSVEVRKI